MPPCDLRADTPLTEARQCNGSDVFGSDICTCRPYLIFGIEEAVKEAQNGGSGVVIYFRKEGRALGEVTKVRVFLGLFLYRWIRSSPGRSTVCLNPWAFRFCCSTQSIIGLPNGDLQSYITLASGEKIAHRTTSRGPKTSRGSKICVSRP